MQETRSVTSRSGVPVGHPSDTPETARRPKLLDRLREALRSRHYSRRTEETFCHQFKRFVSLKQYPATFRYSFTTHFLDGGYDIRTVQELLGHNDVKSTMIYTHVLNRGPAGALSPVDGL